MGLWTKEKFLRMYNSDMENKVFAKFFRSYLEEVAHNSKVHLPYYDDLDIISIASRLNDLIYGSGGYLSQITNKTNRNVTECVIENSEENYASMPYGYRRLDISFADDRNAKYVLDIDSLDMFLRETNKVKNPSFGVDTYKSSCYCLSEKEALSKVKFPSLHEVPVVDDKIENVIVCDRFDPVDNANFNSYLRGKFDHENNLEKLKAFKSKKEMDLIEEYYGYYVPVPHFHFGTKSYTKANRGGQLAISIAKVADYLEDLGESYHRYTTGERDDLDILKYDIGIPFYKIITEEMTFDVGLFIEKSKNILYRLSKSVHGQNATLIKDFYHYLSQSSCENPDSKVFAIADILNFVDEIATDIKPQDQIKLISKIEESCIPSNNMSFNKEENEDIRRDRHRQTPLDD